MPSLIPKKTASPNEDTTPPDYAKLSCNQYNKNFKDKYVVCTLKDAASTYPCGKNLKFFMNEKIEVLSNDKNSFKQIKKKDGTSVDEMDFKFKVVIGTYSNLESKYDADNPCSLKTSIMDKLAPFYTRQFSKDEGDAEAIKQACINTDYLHIIVIGRLLNKHSTRSIPLYSFKEKIIAAAIFKVGRNAAYVVWIAVETHHKYNENNWQFRNKDEKIANDPPIRSCGFGRFLLASIQHHLMMINNDKNCHQMILQSNKKTFARFYNGLHFSIIPETNQLYIDAKKELGDHFLPHVDLFLFQSNCHLYKINPGIYDNSKDKNVFSTVLEHVLDMYYNKIGISYNNIQTIKTIGTKSLLKQQFSAIDANEISYISLNRHSVIVNDTSPSILDKATSILANANTLTMLLNYKSTDNLKKFNINDFQYENNKYNYSLFNTISEILFPKEDMAKFLKFAVSYVYDVMSRLHSKHPFFTEKENDFFLKMVLNY